MRKHIMSHEWGDMSHERENASWLVKNEGTQHESQMTNHIMSHKCSDMSHEREDVSWWVKNEGESRMTKHIMSHKCEGLLWGGYD